MKSFILDSGGDEDIREELKAQNEMTGISRLY
jgi:hypothetical protein